MLAKNYSDIIFCEIHMGLLSYYVACVSYCLSTIQQKYKANCKYYDGPQSKTYMSRITVVNNAFLFLKLQYRIASYLCILFNTY